MNPRPEPAPRSIRSRLLWLLLASLGALMAVNVWFNFLTADRPIDAAFDLVVRDERAWSKFDLTADGFYRSFAAMFIVLPLNIVIGELIVLAPIALA